LIVTFLTCTQHSLSTPFSPPAPLYQVEFRGEGVFPYVVTSQINIVPTDYPFPPCQGEGCYGTLI
jgi:hypothetical protein